MRNVTLTRISSTHSRIRTKETAGFTLALPVEGRDFVMYAPPLESGDVRLISTTTVESICTLDSVIYFKTANSKYMLVLGDEVTE